MNRFAAIVLCLGLTVSAQAADNDANLVPQAIADGSPQGWSAHLLEMAADPGQKCRGADSVRFQMRPMGTGGITVYLFPVDRQAEDRNEAVFDDVRLSPEDRPEINLLPNGNMREIKDGCVVGWTQAGKPRQTAKECDSHTGVRKTCLFVKDDEPQRQEYVTQGVPWQEDLRGKKLVLRAWVRHPTASGTAAMELSVGGVGVFQGFQTTSQWKEISLSLALPGSKEEPRRSGYASFAVPFRPSPAKYYRMSAWVKTAGDAEVTLSACGRTGSLNHSGVTSQKAGSRDFAPLEVVLDPSCWQGNEDAVQLTMLLTGGSGSAAWLASPRFEEVRPGEIGLAAFTEDGRKAFERPRRLGLVAQPGRGYADLPATLRLQGRDFWHVVYDTWRLRPGVRELPLASDCAHRIAHYSFWYPLKAVFERVPPEGSGPIVGQCVGVELTHGAFLDPEFCRHGVPPKEVNQANKNSLDLRPLREKTADLRRAYGDRFLGIQIGEWGNAFGMMQNWGMAWWQNEYWGRNLADLSSPPFPKPKSRQEGWRQMSREFRRIAELFGGDVFFMECSRMWDHYGLELGGRMAYTEYEECYHLRELQIAFARGAARQYDRPWGVYSSTFLGPAWLDYAELAPGTKSQGSPDGGRSLSCMRREHYLTYMSGVNLYEGQTVCLTTQPKTGRPQLTPYGKDYLEFYEFTKRHPDRGRTFVPIAVLLDFIRGDYAPVVNAPWNVLPLEAEDRMMNEVFRTFFPYVTPRDREHNGVCLTNSPFGNSIDVLKPNPPSGITSLAVLRRYPVAILAGGFDMTPQLANRLMEYAQQGGTLVLNVEHLGGHFPETFLGADVTQEVRSATEVRVADGSVLPSSAFHYRVAKPRGAKVVYSAPNGDPIVVRHGVGSGAVLLCTPPYLLTSGGRPLSCLFDLLKELTTESLPLQVFGDIEYQLNRLPDGWVVTLVNNKGVVKDPSTPPVIDAAQKAQVRIVPPSATRTAMEWTTDGEKPIALRGSEIRLDVPPGDVRFVRLVQ